ncbi:MAG TPA: hypothetical protein VEG28_02640, partial [Dehalococcoidia bacterium]|nr:hypothetical protein [Dehalococcoidia bacterium]
LSLNQIAGQALVAPARCCLSDIGQTSATDKKAGACQVSISEERIVEKAFAFLPDISQILRDKYGL